MRISDGGSDGCSSDLAAGRHAVFHQRYPVQRVLLLRAVRQRPQRAPRRAPAEAAGAAQVGSAGPLAERALYRLGDGALDPRMHVVGLLLGPRSEGGRGGKKGGGTCELRWAPGK